MVGSGKEGSRGNAQLGVVGSGAVRQLWKGLSRRGPVRFCLAVKVRSSLSRWCQVRSGKVWQSW